MKVFASKHLSIVITLFLVSVLTVFVVFYGYLPVKYNLNVGSVCSEDIYAPRKFIDSYQTQYEALLEQNKVIMNPIFVRDEDLATSNVDVVRNYFATIIEARKNLEDQFGNHVDDDTGVVQNLIDTIDLNFDVELSEEEARKYVTLGEAQFDYIQNNTISCAELIMSKSVDSGVLVELINSEVDSSQDDNSAYGKLYKPMIKDILIKILKHNAEMDKVATEEAAANAYNSIMNNPIYVDKGTKIISAGELVTDHEYRNLCDLELIRENVFDWVFFARIFAYCMILFLALWLFISKSNSFYNMEFKLSLILSVTYLIPIFVAVYLSGFSEYATIVLFFTTIASTYLGTQKGIILSLFSLLIMWPMYDFNSGYIFIYGIGIIVCSVLAGSKSERNYSASLILLPTLSVILASGSYSFINNTTRTDFILDLTWSSLSALVSVVFAIGFMPIYESITDVVSPLKLITLSQTGNPLLKKMFVECPGTSQHSIMVSNLAESAAESIGADALLCKVASYYHDIGKLREPAFFTENQSGYNPHDGIEIMQSVEIITNHVDYGVKLAEKNKIPDAIIKIIKEHHGNTYPKYFYHKACNQANENSLPEPSVDAFRYRGNIPSSKESAIIMLADTCEAAIKSAKINSKDEAEVFIRKLVKEKISEDQMADSGLSFGDIDKIINSFVQVYTGMFHERIKYPE